MKYSFAVFALINSANAYTTVLPPELHWNEDPHSRPNPLSGEYPDRTMTTTQARWLRNGTSDEQLEPPGKIMQFHVPYNRDATEYVQIDAEDSDSDSDDSEAVFLRQAGTNLVQWVVTPDYGELDGQVLDRERDVANGFKYGGYGLTAWHNPLADADDGHDDDQILLQ